MTENTTGDLPLGPLLEDPEEMRRSGYEVVDAIVARWAQLRDGPAWRGATRDRVEPLLHGPAPEEGRDLEGLLDTIVKDMMPFAARVDHPRFLAFIPSNPTWASVLASFLIAGYNVFQGTWLQSSGPSQIEVTVLDWFRDWLGYPAAGSGVLTSGGSAANLLAIVTAREAAGNPERGTVYVSEQAHGSVARAARVAGIQSERVRLVETDGFCRIVPDSLRAAIGRDRAAGMHPFLIVGNGNLSREHVSRCVHWLIGQHAADMPPELPQTCSCLQQPPSARLVALPVPGACAEAVAEPGDDQPGSRAPHQALRHQRPDDSGIHH